MQSISYRDLQEITSSALPKQLASEGAIVITIDNKPFAIMVSPADENIQIEDGWTQQDDLERNQLTDQKNTEETKALSFQLMETHSNLNLSTLNA